MRIDSQTWFVRVRLHPFTRALAVRPVRTLVFSGLRNNICLLVSVVIRLLFALPPAELSGLNADTPLIVHWNLMVWLYVVLSGVMMPRPILETVRLRALTHDEGPRTMLAIAILAAVASLAAMMVELADIKNFSTAQVPALCHV